MAELRILSSRPESLCLDVMAPLARSTADRSKGTAEKRAHAREVAK